MGVYRAELYPVHTRCIISRIECFFQGNRIKKTRKINDLGITRVLAYVYI